MGLRSVSDDGWWIISECRHTPSKECRVHSLIWNWTLLLWQHQQVSEHQLTSQLPPGERARRGLHPANMWSLGGLVCVCFYHAHVSVDVEDAFVGALLVQFGQHKLLHAKHNAIFTANRNGRAAHKHTQTHAKWAPVCCSGAFRGQRSSASSRQTAFWLITWSLQCSPAVLHSFHGVLHLKHSTVRREGGGWQVILQDTHTTLGEHEHRGRECVCYECVTECRLLVSWQAQIENLNHWVSAVLFVPLLTQFWTVDPDWMDNLNLGVT